MDAWENDRRRSGGAGWALDDSGEWVATSAEPEAPPEDAATAAAVSAPAQKRAAGRGILRGLLTVVVIPALAAAVVLYVWKGPGGEIVLSRIEPLVAAFLESRDSDPAPVEDAAEEAMLEASSSATTRSQARPMPQDMPAFQSQALPALPDCASVRRGMADSIVFHRAGGCPD